VECENEKTKKILMIATGGTIASVVTTDGLAPLMTPDEILQYIPDVSKICQVHTLQLFNLDSTDICQEHWLLLSEAICTEYENYDGFVICHGTDTMAYTAAALSYLIQHSPKPIVITGAQKPINEDNTDSKLNLYSSFLYASSDAASGVQILFNGKVILGTRARKTHSKSFHAFSSINYPYLAVLQDNIIMQYLTYKKNDKPEFYHQLNTKVALLRLIPGMSSEILSFLLKTNDAVVIESFGVGGVPSLKQYHYYDIIETWLKQGKIIVMTTQVPNEGSDMNVYKVGKKIKRDLNILEAYDMTTEAVVTKLMWILAFTNNQEKVRKLFYTPVGCDFLYTAYDDTKI